MMMMMVINSSLVKTQPSYPISSLQTNLDKSPLFIPYRPTNFNPTTFAKLEYHGDAGVKSEQSPSSSSSSQVVVKNEMGMGRRLLVTGAASVGFVGIMMLLGHDNALALGPEGPLMEEFWENVRRYFLYALTVSTGVLYSVFQPIYELLRNPISAILVLVIIGGTFYIGSQVLSAMVGLSDFDYQYAAIVTSPFTLNLLQGLHLLHVCMMPNYDEAQKPLLRGSNNNIIKEDTLDSIEENRTINRIRFRRVRTTPSTHSNPLHSTPPPPPPLSSPYITDHKPAFLHVFLVLALYLGVGTLCFVLVRAQLDGKKTSDVVDALYFCIVTMTTVGYGDLVPATTLAKLLSCFFVFTGMAIVGMILSQAVDYFVEKHEALMAKALHLRDKATPAQILKEVETNKTKYKMLMTLLSLIMLITLGTFFLTLHEDMMLIDAFYCVCATITTLGYGDASFVTRGGRIFAVFWILSSTLCLAQFFFYLTEFYTESRRRSILKWVLSRKLTLADIEAADLDNDHVVSVAEFILHKLKEMEKINVEDVNLLMDRFKNLDVDESGTLTAADVLESTEI